MATTTELATLSLQAHSSRDAPHYHEQTPAAPREAETPIQDDNFRPTEFSDAEMQDRQLPQADGGAAAWKFLFGAFMIEACQWGFALSFGVFQSYYSENEPFRGNKNIAVVGTLTTGVLFLGAPLMTPLVRRYPRWHKEMIYVGWGLSILALIGASFAKSMGALIATQGVLYSLGVTVMYFPIISMLNEWFIAKRGFALGLVTASTGVSGIVMPFILASLLNKYGYETTLRAVAVALVILTGPALPMLKGRLPPPQSSMRAKTDTSFLRKPLFYFFAASVLLQGLGYFYPTLYLPSYASNLGYSPAIGALLLALFSLTQVFGQVSCGYLSDNRVSVETLAFVFPLVSGIAVFSLWGLARSLPPLIIFSLLYGFFGGGYVVLWAKMGTELSDSPTVALATFGIFAFLKGVGNVITGPISAGLISPNTLVKQYAIGRYKWVVSYSGVCMFMCSGTMIALYARRRIKSRV